MTEQTLRAEYKDELCALESKMLRAQKFAEKFPAFAEHILAHKFTDEFTGDMGRSYKGMYFGWGIKRWFYREAAHITNYRGEFSPQYLWNIYINQVSLFDTYVDTGLYQICNNTDVFFFDNLNTTFYATDEQIIPLLDAISEWYAKAKKINAEFVKEKRKEELLRQLENLK